MAALPEHFLFILTFSLKMEPAHLSVMLCNVGNTADCHVVQRRKNRYNITLCLCCKSGVCVKI
jgi:hypothetical protein